MIAGVLAFFFGKIGLFTIGGMLVAGTVGAFMLLGRRVGTAMVMATACYFAAGVFWQAAYTQGASEERAKWEVLVQEEKRRVAAANAGSIKVGEELKQARAQLVMERRSRVELIKDKIAQEESDRDAEEPVPPAGTVCPPARPRACTDSERDVERLRRLLRGR